MNKWLLSSFILLIILNIVLLGYYLIIKPSNLTKNSSQIALEKDTPKSITLVSDVEDKTITFTNKPFLAKMLDSTSFWSYRSVYLPIIPPRATVNALIIHLTTNPQTLLAYRAKGIASAFGYSIGTEYEQNQTLDLYISFDPAVLQREDDATLSKEFSYFTLIGVFYLTHTPDYHSADRAYSKENNFVAPLWKVTNSSFVEIK